MADYSSDKFEITILTNRIFKLRPFEGMELNVSDVEEMRGIYLKFSNNESFAILLDATHPSTLIPEARVLLASEEFAVKRIAAAFVTRSLASKIIGNFFIQFNKPASPTKMFNDEKSALEWLQEKIKTKTKNPEGRSGLLAF
jgi:hypothetical protein